MKNLARAISVLITLAAGPLIGADVATTIEKAYVPAVFSTDERVQFMVRAYQPNGCYKPSRTSYSVDKARKIVTLTQYVSESDEMCIQLVERFNKEIDLGGLSPGEYTLRDSSGNRRLGSFKVDARSERLNKHVPITAVELQEASGEILVAGVQTSGCIEVEELQSRFERDDVVVVHPIARVAEDGLCTRDIREFTKTLRLRFSEPTLLHVKNADGTSINQIVY